MRYFLDTEFDGYAGRLISLALVADNGEELYLVIDGPPIAEPWVERNVVPYLDHVPEMMRGERFSRRDAAAAVMHFLAHDLDPEIIADWPEDLAQFSMLLVTGPGEMERMPGFTLRYISLRGFSTARNSAVPHNALHDARALRDHLANILD